jgi:paraquat-inducible protein B
VKAGLFRGLQFDVDSLRSLVVGGVSMSVLAGEGGEVEDGHRFILHDEPDDKWLDWAPL